MRRRNWAWCGLLLMAAGCSGDEERCIPIERKNWAIETEHREGQILSGKTITKSFDFFNPTDSPHKITRITKGCACAKAWMVTKGEEIPYNETPKFPIVVLPGERSAIKILLDMSGVIGPEKAEVHVETTDPANRVIKFLVTAMGVPFFKVVPSCIDLGEVGLGQAAEFSVNISSDYVSKWEISEDIKAPPQVEIKKREKVIVNDKVHATLAGTVQEREKYGPLIGMIRIETDVEGRVIDIPISMIVSPPFMLDPPDVLPLGIVNGRKGKSATVKIKKCKGTQGRCVDYAFENLSLGPNWIEVSLNRGAEDDVCELTIKVLPKAPKGPIKGKLIIFFDVPGFKYKSLDLSGVIV